MVALLQGRKAFFHIQLPDKRTTYHHIGQEAGSRPAQPFSTNSSTMVAEQAREAWANCSSTVN